MDRSLKTRYPKLFKELDNKKNHLNINKISYGSNQQVYWICSKKHSWLAKPKERTRNKNPKRCTVCRSLDFNYPELIKEWDFKKNKLDPKTTNYGSAVYDRDLFHKPLGHASVYKSIMHAKDRGQNFFSMGVICQKNTILN